MNFARWPDGETKARGSAGCWHGNRHARARPRRGCHGRGWPPPSGRAHESSSSHSDSSRRGNRRMRDGSSSIPSRRPPAAFRLDAAQGCRRLGRPPAHAARMRSLIEAVRRCLRPDPHLLEKPSIARIAHANSLLNECTTRKWAKAMACGFARRSPPRLPRWSEDVLSLSLISSAAAWDRRAGCPVLARDAAVPDPASAGVLAAVFLAAWDGS